MIFHYNGYGTSITAIVVHGSVQAYFDENHRLIKLLKEYCKEILSIVLPGHGHNVGIDDDFESLSAETAVTRFRNEILVEIVDKRVVFIGYSIGGLFGLKIWTNLVNSCKTLSGIFIGCALRINPGNFSVVQQFFSPEFFEKLQWDMLTKKIHGEKWKLLVITVAKWLNPDSQLFLTPLELEKLESSKDSIYFILGNSDQPFSSKDIYFAGNYPVLPVECDHFGYFLQHGAWNQVEKYLRDTLAKIIQ